MSRRPAAQDGAKKNRAKISGAAPKAAGRTLKVFAATLGFYDTVVAAPSQAAALRAWGSHQNLFADKTARLADDANAIEAALARPQVVLRRAIGTFDPYGLEPGLPKIPDLPRQTPSGSAATARKRVKPASPPPDRTALDKAEAALARLEHDHRAELDALAARRRALDAEYEKAAIRFEAAQASARHSIERERKAYAKAARDVKR